MKKGIKDALILTKGGKPKTGLNILVLSQGKFEQAKQQRDNDRLKIIHAIADEILEKIKQKIPNEILKKETEGKRLIDELVEGALDFENNEIKKATVNKQRAFFGHESSHETLAKLQQQLTSCASAFDEIAAFACQLHLGDFLSFELELR